MEIWSKCDICGRDIPVGELCYGLKNGNCICKDCCTGFENCTFTLAPAPTLTPPNKWVAVEERLPEKHSEYIVCACDEGEPIDERIWGDTVVVCADYYDGAFTWYEGNTEYDISDIVTHWMSLPEPPDCRPPEGEA